MEIISKAFDPAEVNFTPGEASDVAWITCDCVDNEGDVVVSKGVDFKSVYMKNPVVMSCHDLSKWPVGQCAWIKLAQTPAFTGLCAKTMWDSDPDAMKLFAMVQRKLVNGRSIHFRPPTDYRPGDWGPPTPDEIKARPDWADASRVIRRCVMFEYSVVPIGMNQEALTIAVAKGLELPSYLALDPQPTTAASIPEMPPHRTFEEITAQLEAELAKSFDPARIVEQTFQAALDRARGVI